MRLRLFPKIQTYSQIWITFYRSKRNRNIVDLIMAADRQPFSSIIERGHAKPDLGVGHSGQITNVGARCVLAVEV